MRRTNRVVATPRRGASPKRCASGHYSTGSRDNDADKAVRCFGGLIHKWTSAKTIWDFGANSPSPRLRGRSRFGAAKARPAPIGWVSENNPPSVGVSNHVGSRERRVWLFPLPSDGRGSGCTAIELRELRQDRSADFSPLPAVLGGPEGSGLKSALLNSTAVGSG